jgi:hypothetical protein
LCWAEKEETGDSRSVVSEFDVVAMIVVGVCLEIEWCSEIEIEGLDENELARDPAECGTQN